MERVSDALRLLRDAPRLSADYAWSLGAARSLAREFVGLSAYVEFIGYPRSGHTLVGSLLDAHSQVVIANELGALRYLTLGFSMPQIYALLLRSSRDFTTKGRQSWYGYQYGVEGQWQGGRYTALRVIGDKQGMGTALRLRERPWLLDRLRQQGKPLRFIHTHRNFFDSISTQARWRGQPLRQTVTEFMTMLDSVETQRQRMDAGEWFDLGHEDFVRDPRGSLQALAAFLGVEAPDDWMAACASIVFTKPRQPRFEVEWPPELIEQVEARLAASPVLGQAAYRFAD